MVKIVPDASNNLTKESTADCFQVKSMSTDRFDTKIGEISGTDFDKIKEALRNVFDL